MRSKYIIIGILLISVLMVYFEVDFNTASSRLFKPIKDFGDFLNNYISPDGTFSLKKLLFPDVTDMYQSVSNSTLWQKVVDWFYDIFH